MKVRCRAKGIKFVSKRNNYIENALLILKYILKLEIFLESLVVLLEFHNVDYYVVFKLNWSSINDAIEKNVEA